MQQAGLCSGTILALAALTACSAPANAPGGTRAGTLPLTGASLPAGAAQATATQTGQLVVRVMWPRRIQTIPYSTNLLDLAVQDAAGATVASASLQESTGQTTSLATLTVPAGTISLDASAYASATLVASGTATASVPVNRQVAANLALVPVYLPTIATLSANAGPGALLWITGSNFGASRNVPISVTFDGIPSPEVWAVDNGDLEAMVPSSGFSSGSVVVTADAVQSAPSAQTFTLLTGLSPLSTDSATLSVGQTLDLAVTASDSAGVVTDPWIPWSLNPASANMADLASGSFSAATGSATIFTAAATGSGILTVRSGFLISTASLVVQ